MRFSRSLPLAVVLAVLFLPVALSNYQLGLAAAGLPSPQPMSGLTTLDFPPSGRIVYGPVPGATSHAAAMAAVLRSIHQQYGERPRISSVLRVRGGNQVAVFFTAARRNSGNAQVAGIVMAAESAPGRMEAAMVSDHPEQLKTSFNPMMQKLFSVWNPGAQPSADNSERGAQPARQASGIRVPPMHRVTLQDRTASAEVPDGWRIEPAAHGGTMVVLGPHGGGVVMNTSFMAQDPANPNYIRMARANPWYKPLPGTTIIPYNADFARAFGQIYTFQAQSIHWHPTNLTVDQAEMMPPSPGSRCVHATFHVDRGKGMFEVDEMLCAQQPDQTGAYHFTAFFYELPAATVSDTERATAAAIMKSFQWDEALVAQRATAEAAPFIAQMQRNYERMESDLIARSQRAVDNIHAIGAQATQRMRDNDLRNEQQHQQWRNQQDVDSRNAQGFSNYLLDQTVVQDNLYNAHGTVWNSTADALVKHDPNRFEIVDTPNYWKGIDY